MIIFILLDFINFIFEFINNITPLHYLCLHGNSETILKILLSNDEVDVNAMTYITKKLLF